MTVSSQINKSGPYLENGVTTEFEYEFKIADASHIKVVRATAGVETVLELTADYTVTGVGNAAGGNVVIGTPVSGSTLTLILNVPFTQELDLENQGAYNAEDVEKALDLAVQRDKQLAEQISRAVVVPVTSDIDPDQLIADLEASRAAAVAAAASAEDDAAQTAADRLATAADAAAAAGYAFGFAVRNLANATYGAALGNGRIFGMAGLLYLVDSTATGVDSCTNDLGVDGLVPYGPAQQGHFGGWAAFDGWKNAAPEWRSIRIGRPTSGTYDFFADDRGMTARLAKSEISTFSIVPNDDWVNGGSPDNGSLAELKIYNIDVAKNPSLPRRMITASMHRDIDKAERGRLATRAENAARHPDFYLQINGAQPLYIAKKRDGTSGLVSTGIFPGAYRFKNVTTPWAASTAVTVGQMRTVPYSDHLYLECSVAGTTGTTAPVPPVIGATVADGTATWVSRSRLQHHTGDYDALPAIWADQNGNVGFGTQSPAYDYDVAKRLTMREGIAFDNGGSVGATLLNIRTATATITFGSIAAGASANFDIALAGAAEGDSVALGIPWAQAQTGIIFQSYVRSAGQVRVECQNVSASSKTVTAGTFRVTVFKF